MKTAPPNLGIEIPKVKVLATGAVITAEQAKEVSTRPQIVSYVYAEHEFAMIVNPRAVTNDAEDKVNEIQLRFSEIANIDVNALASKVNADNMDAVKDQVASELAASGSFKEMAHMMRELENAQIDMLAPAILWCNDPAEENYPSAEVLKKGGKLAKAQLEAILKWWNPIEPAPSAAKTQTEKA